MNTTATPRRLATALLLAAAAAACSDPTVRTADTTVPHTTATTSQATAPATSPEPTSSTSPAQPPSPVIVPYDAVPVPGTRAGAQLTWFLGAIKHLPIATEELERHLAASVLGVLPPDQLNAGLAAAGEVGSARYLGVLATTDTSIEAVVEYGPGRLARVIVGVDADGLIDDLRFALVPVRPRAEVGLEPLRLPAPTGPSPVGTRTIVTPPGDGSGAHGSAGRLVPAQLWYPSAPAGTEGMAPYAPPATGSILAEQLAVPGDDIALIETGATVSPPVERDRGELPVVVVAPGFGIARSHYAVLATELASHGYLVAVLDHPGGPSAVEYPDGTIVPAGPETPEFDVAAELAIRVADANAVVELLTRLDATPGSEFHDALDLERIAFTGHSIGGASAAEAMRLDRRYDVGANLDGTMSGDVLSTGLDRPFLLMGRAEGDESWDAFRSASRATTLVRIDGVAHMSFSDWPALAALRPRDDIGAEQIGTMDPTRSIAIQREYLLAFLDLHLRGVRSSLLDGDTSRYPEVDVD